MQCYVHNSRNICWIFTDVVKRWWFYCFWGKEAWICVILLSFCFILFYPADKKKKNVTGMLPAYAEWVPHSWEILSNLWGPRVVPVRASWMLCPGPALRFTCHPVWFLLRIGSWGRHWNPKGRVLEPMKQRDAEARTWEQCRCRGTCHVHTCRNWPLPSPFTVELTQGAGLNHCFRYWLCSNQVDNMVEVFPQQWISNISKS